MAEPVTPDREALVRAVLDDLARFPIINLRREDGYDNLASFAVDAVLPLLTDALDRARQQGRNEAGRRFFGDAYPTVDRLARGGPNRKDDE